jgi:hypothetical protein
MNMKLDGNKILRRFVPCVHGMGLIVVMPEAAGCTLGGRTFSFSPAGFGFSDDFKPAFLPINNLTRSGFFRGKIPQRKTQNNKHRLEERTLTAPNS